MSWYPRHGLPKVIFVNNALKQPQEVMKIDSVQKHNMHLLHSSLHPKTLGSYYKIHVVHEHAISAMLHDFKQWLTAD